MIIGFTSGVFDLFHVGHLNVLKNARSHCDRLIVGVIPDETRWFYKPKKSVIPLEQRCEIVRSIKFVDEVVVHANLDKVAAWKALGFHVAFVGSDWQGTERWIKQEADLKAVGVPVIYLPYTPGISTTAIVNSIRCGDA